MHAWAGGNIESVDLVDPERECLRTNAAYVPKHPGARMRAPHTSCVAVMARRAYMRSKVHVCKRGGRGGLENHGVHTVYLPSTPEKEASCAESAASAVSTRPCGASQQQHTRAIRSPSTVAGAGSARTWSTSRCFKSAMAVLISSFRLLLLMSTEAAACNPRNRIRVMQLPLALASRHARSWI